MIYIFLVTLFLLGLAFGSFLNAFEYRLFNKKDWVKARSHCPNCKHELSALDLIPIFSWLFLRGKCRYCGKKISWQYPVVELVMGILFVGYGFVFFSRDNPRFAPTMTEFLIVSFGLIVVWSLVFFTVYDLKYGLIPNKVLYPLIGLTLLRNISFSLIQILDKSLLVSVTGFNFWNNLLAGILAGLFFLIIILLTKGKGMGGGDMKLAFWFGLVLGCFPTLVSLYLSFMIGGIYGAIVLIMKKKKMGQAIPFGPFLCLGFLIVFFGQDWILHFANKIIFGNMFTFL